MTDPNYRGDLAEAKCKAKLIEEDYKIYEPVRESDRADLVIEKDGELLKVQIKSSHYKNGKVVFKTKSEMSHKSHKYNGDNYVGDVDYFMVYNKTRDEYYWVSVEEAPKTGMELRVEDAKHNQSTINWAEDYRFPV